MQRITLLAVGTLKQPWVKDGCGLYIDRLRHAAKFEIVEVPAGKQKDPVKQKEEEGRKLLQALEKAKGEAWLLDETGDRMTSDRFAEFLGKACDAGRHLVFVLGGAYGLGDDVRKAARGCIRLSDMTFPHELCRLVYLEQLYRATEIRKGSGYHHA